ncbi:hypothetical protein [Cellulophaga baltica]|uniref:hypothetical protein n=1 Tax=Cellulophaga baltica TaxID=76594 RepID=UPI0015F4CE8C|nr:hypothetical protein [Cellulophaga baltica]MBA6316266.1 hypothetical protein [Cellulophaga baltica]
MKNSLGQRMKIQMGLESEEERNKRIALEKKDQQKAIEYFDRINSLTEEKPKYVDIPLEWFKKELWTEGKNYFSATNRFFEVDDENKLFLDIICRYFTNDKEFEKITNGELRKGLLIYGGCGTGKSSIFDIIQAISFKHNLKQIHFKNTSVHTVVTEFNKESRAYGNGGEFIIEKYSKGTVHFDDLGTEKQVQAWGIKEDLFDRILQIRYNNYKASGNKTFVTTNLSLDKLEKRYSPQVKSRLYEMFNIIPLVGNDRRF